MSELVLKHIGKIYPAGNRKGKDVVAVDDFNLESKGKEFIVFVGPSGCGKSTTLRMIAGLEEITKGQLFIDGELVNSIEPKYRNIAMVFQNYALYPHMTAYENMAFGLKNMKVEKPLVDKEGKPVLGIDKKLIKDIKKEIKLNEKRIAKNTSCLNKVEELKAKQDGVTGKQLEKLQNQIDHYENLYDDKLNEILKEKNEKYQKDIVHFETTPVQLYKHVHLSKEEIDEKINEAAKILDIESLLNRKPKAMSGGQRQRVALGRAIVRTPKLFLLDEPLSNLDAKLRAAMRVEITNLYNKLNTTFIYVTHDQVEAMTMGTRIVVMRSGVVQQIDTPVNLYDYPENRFVAGFLGTPQMNFAEVEIQKVGDELVVYFDETNKITASLKNMRTVEEQYLDGDRHSAIFGIRSENITIDENSELKFKVTLVETLGAETLIYVNNGATKLVIKTNIRTSKVIGDEIGVSIQGDKMHLFSSDEERSILHK